VPKQTVARKSVAKRPVARTRATPTRALTTRTRRAPVARRAPVRPVTPPRPRRAAKPASPRRRLLLILVTLAVALVLIGSRLVELQGFGQDHYDALAADQRVRTVTLAAERGSIFDRNGNDLALSVPQQTVYADPARVRNPVAYAAKLAPLVGVDRSTLADRLATPGLRFVYVARKVDDATAKRVKALHLPGVGFVSESKRFYPAEALAAPVLGFVGTDKGLGGLESDYEQTLKGRPGRLVAEADPSGREIPATQQRDVPARRGGDLVLTLDQSLQYEVERQLTDQVQATRAKGGMAIVADVKTGDVLAMATVDGPTATTVARPAPASELNRPLTTVYEPGSTNKVITITGALDAGAVGADQSFVVPPSVSIAGVPFADAESHGVMQWNVSDIMRESSNVGTIQIAKLLGKDRLNQYLRGFGFGEKTRIGFPGESAGIVLDPARYTATSMGSIPIGYELSVTPMQMLDVFMTVANGGVSVPPRLVQATIDADGTRHDRAPSAGRRVVSTEAALRVNPMLQAVVTGGTGAKAAVPGYTVAGKTGTARKPPYEKPYRYMASFAGFAPAESPRLAAIVVLDEPGTSYYGGDVAAPVFSRIMQYALRLEHVPPTVPIDAALPEYTGASSNDVPAGLPSPSPGRSRSTKVTNQPAGNVSTSTP
jgi:cell division protein FtsI (penicillin-binding protein 3)